MKNDKKEKILSALDGIEEKYLNEAADKSERKEKIIEFDAADAVEIKPTEKKRNPWAKYSGLAAAVAVIVAAGILIPNIIGRNIAYTMGDDEVVPNVPDNSTYNELSDDDVPSDSSGNIDVFKDESEDINSNENTETTCQIKDLIPIDQTCPMAEYEGKIYYFYGYTDRTHIEELLGDAKILISYSATSSAPICDCYSIKAIDKDDMIAIKIGGKYYVYSSDITGIKISGIIKEYELLGIMLSEEQAKLLEELYNTNNPDYIRYPYKEGIILGTIDENAPRLTYQQAVEIISKYNDFGTILLELEKIQKPDETGGSGVSFIKYALSESEEILIVIEQQDIVYSHTSNDGSVTTEELFVEKSESTDITEDYQTFDCTIDDASDEYIYVTVETKNETNNLSYNALPLSNPEVRELADRIIAGDGVSIGDRVRIKIKAGFDFENEKVIDSVLQIDIVEG